MTGSLSIRPIVFFLAFLPLVALAHHSRTEFAQEVREVEGEIVQFTWANPHPDFTLSVVNDAGDEEFLQIQVYGTMYTLQRAGVTGEQFEAGQRVRFALQPSTRREGLHLTTAALLPDGTEVIMSRNERPRWSANYVGGRDAVAADAGDAVDAAAENRGIFRVWSPPIGGFPTGTGNIPRATMTEAAEKLRAEFDDTDNWNMRCESPGMSIVMTGPSAFEFTDEGDSISVWGGHYEFVRTIHMTDAEDPETQPRSPLGYSVGRWEDERALVVETTRVNWPYLDFRGTPQSEDVSFLERLTLSEDQALLNYRLTINDPVMLLEPSIMDLTWIALGETLDPVDNLCETER